jgi:hypothetical protein
MRNEKPGCKSSLFQSLPLMTDSFGVTGVTNPDEMIQHIFAYIILP